MASNDISQPDPIEEARKRDALALAELIYDIYQEDKAKKRITDEPEAIKE
jgi:hypothetical protein